MSIAAPTRWFVFRRRIPLPNDASEFGLVRQRVEKSLRGKRALHWRTLDEHTVSFWGPFMVRVRLDVPRPWVLVTLRLRTTPGGAELECMFDYRVYGWFTVACLLLLVVPIVGSAPWDLSERALAILAFGWAPILYFWVNFTLFVRSLRRLVSAQGPKNSHQLR